MILGFKNVSGPRAERQPRNRLRGGYSSPYGWVLRPGSLTLSTHIVPLMRLAIPVHRQSESPVRDVALETYRNPASTPTMPSIALRTVEPGRFEPFARMAKAISRSAWSTR